MGAPEVRAWLGAIEHQVDEDSEAAAVALAYVAGRSLSLADDELNGARRRALFVLAAGGDPHRTLHVDDRAVATLADELASPERMETLSRALLELDAHARALPATSRLLRQLAADPHRAWRHLACGLLAEELADG